MKKFSIHRILLLFLLVIILDSPALVSAQDNNPISDDEVNALAKELYCPVCENIPLDVCPTKACAQWRELIRDKMALGWNENQIKEFFAEQYGDQVLAVPPRRGFNWLIYVLPPLVVVAGVFMVARIVRSNGKKASTPVAQEKPSADVEVIDEIERDLRREE